MKRTALLEMHQSALNEIALYQLINMRHAVFRRGAFQAHKVSISITEGEFQSLDLSGEFH